MSGCGRRIELPLKTPSPSVTPFEDVQSCREPSQHRSAARLRPILRLPAAIPNQPTLRVPVDIRSVSLFVLATVACVFMLKQMEDVLVPIVLGALIFYALAPAVEWMVRHRVPRTIAAIIMMLALIGGARRRGLRPVGRSDGGGPGHAADRREAAAVHSRLPAAEQRFAVADAEGRERARADGHARRSAATRRRAA